jgi:hypothetical protein
MKVISENTLYLKMIIIFSIIAFSCKENSTNTIEKSKPIIESISSNHLLQGKTLTIYGNHFNNYSTGSKVIFNSTEAEIKYDYFYDANTDSVKYLPSWSDSTISVKVPDVSESGFIRIISGTDTSNAYMFNLVKDIILDSIRSISVGASFLSGGGYNITTSTFKKEGSEITINNSGSIVTILFDSEINPSYILSVNMELSKYSSNGSGGVCDDVDTWKFDITNRIEGESRDYFSWMVNFPERIYGEHSWHYYEVDWQNLRCITVSSGKEDDELFSINISLHLE